MVKKQSKASWRKRGAPFEALARQARQQVDQERRTGGSLATVSEEQLFAVDRAGKGSLRGAPTGRKAKAVRPKELWVDRVVAPNPNIRPVVSPRSKSSKPTAATLALRAKIGKARESVQRKLALRTATAAPTTAAETLDIWGAAVVAEARPPRASRRGALRRMPEAAVEAEAVKPPAEGASWNPEFEAHQALLAAATEHELERQRRERKTHNVALFGKYDEDDEDGDEAPAEAATTEDWEKMDAEEDEDEDEDATREGGFGSWHMERPKVTTAQRNKRARAKAREEEVQRAKAARLRERQAERTGSLLADIKREERARQSKQEAEKAWEEQKPKKLGPKVHEPRRPDVLLSDEQPSAMRHLTTEGSLMVDRFDSFQARNMIEVRERVPRIRRKIRKVYTEEAKGTKYKSPYGYAGNLPAWL